MPPPLQEVTYHPIQGTNQGDFISIVGLSSIQAGVDHYWDGTVIAKGGDDFIHFEPILDWDPLNWQGGPKPLSFNGGSGTDMVSLSNSVRKVDVNLSTGEGSVIIPPYISWGGQEWTVIPRNITMNLNSIENFSGGTRDDQITGSNGANILQGLAGDDTIKGGGGDDIIQGGTGADTLWGEAGEDRIFGGAGNDDLHGGSDNDFLRGDGGNDTLNGGTGNDEMEGGTGNDLLNGGSGMDLAVYDTAGDVTINLLSGKSSGALGVDTLQSIEKVETGAGDDVVTGDHGANKFWLGDGNDTAHGNSGIDRIKGLDGNDTLYGDGGADSLYGGEGHDDLFGGFDADLLRGGDGNDRLYGQQGGDTMLGEGGNDALYGGDHEDNLQGGTGNDTLYGGDGEDTINGGTGNDLISGGDGNDTIHTGGGIDTLFRYKNDTGIDTVFGFDDWEDNFRFETGTFDHSKFASQSLSATQVGQDALLFIENPDDSWEAFALLKDVNAGAINQRIANNDIFGAEPNGNPNPFPEGDAPGDSELGSLSDFFLI